jgi:hypothetical protein
MSLGAAAIHFAVFPEHLRMYVPFGLFFVVVAWLQAMWAVGVVAVPKPWVLMAGMLGSLVVIAVWVASRTWGVPLGPGAGWPEAASSVGVAGVLAVLAMATVTVAIPASHDHGDPSSHGGSPHGLIDNPLPASSRSPIPTWFDEPWCDPMRRRQ